MTYGPQLPISQEVGQEKHYPGETFEEAMRRIAKALADDAEHERQLVEILLDQRFIPAGRIQRAAGSFDVVTAFNCFVSGTIPDDMEGIFNRVTEAALTMKKGGGIGYSFGTIRPKGTLIESLRSSASGAVSFMQPFDAACGTVSSAGNRRGAQMGVLPVWHPDIVEFVEAKGKQGNLTNFNVSVGMTDAFMQCVLEDGMWELTWQGEVHDTIPARDLWNKIMAMTWDWAEPGVLFLDTINRQNNLWYCEEIAATNPCGEQPLPPFGACLLGSFNWVKYVAHRPDANPFFPWVFDRPQFAKDISVIVRAMDNVIDRTVYPLPEQEQEAKAKRRMGLGAMGVANALEALGIRYGTPAAEAVVEDVLQFFANECYMASVDLAREKGAFPLFDAEKYLQSEYIQKLDPWVQDGIRRWGIRNSHLTSIAPTGSISLGADNVSGGIEPPFAHFFDRTILMADGSSKVERVKDYALHRWGIEGCTANELTPAEHVGMLTSAQKWIDSAVSKTCNIGDDVTFEEFKDVYMMAWQGGAKGCTTFRAAGKRFGVLNIVAEEPAEEIDEGAACFIDPATGKKTCE